MEAWFIHTSHTSTSVLQKGLRCSCQQQFLIAIQISAKTESLSGASRKVHIGFKHSGGLELKGRLMKRNKKLEPSVRQLKGENKIYVEDI